MKKLNYSRGLTHAGVFHADDVFSTAFLTIINPGIEIERVNRVSENMPDDIIVFDIGFGRFDHHQKDCEVRENGIKYAAFGLLWRAFGNLIVSEKNVTKFDISFVQFIDDADNGGQINPMTSAISAFVPNWDDSKDMEAAFVEAVGFAQIILHHEIERLLASERAQKEVQTALDNSDGEIVVLDRFAPWQDILIPSTAKFVVFPSLRGGYSAQAVPSVLGGRDQKVSFPAEWAGVDKDNLNAILTGLTFCHPGRFMIGADTVDTAVQACRIAIG